MRARTDTLGLSKGADRSTCWICLMEAVTDQVTTEGNWPDPFKACGESMRRYRAVLAGEMRCPAMDTCETYKYAMWRRNYPEAAALLEDALKPSRIRYSGGEAIYETETFPQQLPSCEGRVNA